MEVNKAISKNYTQGMRKILDKRSDNQKNK